MNSAAAIQHQAGRWVENECCSCHTASDRFLGGRQLPAILDVEEAVSQQHDCNAHYIMAHGQ
jgi:hypothetical protein